MILVGGVCGALWLLVVIAGILCLRRERTLREEVDDRPKVSHWVRR